MGCGRVRTGRWEEQSGSRAAGFRREHGRTQVGRGTCGGGGPCCGGGSHGCCCWQQPWAWRHPSVAGAAAGAECGLPAGLGGGGGEAGQRTGHVAVCGGSWIARTNAPQILIRYARTCTSCLYMLREQYLNPAHAPNRAIRWTLGPSVNCPLPPPRARGPDITLPPPPPRPSPALPSSGEPRTTQQQPQQPAPQAPRLLQPAPAASRPHRRCSPSSSWALEPSLRGCCIRAAALQHGHSHRWRCGRRHRRVPVAVPWPPLRRPEVPAAIMWLEPAAAGASSGGWRRRRLLSCPEMRLMRCGRPAMPPRPPLRVMAAAAAAGSSCALPLAPWEVAVAVAARALTSAFPHVRTR